MCVAVLRLLTTPFRFVRRFYRPTGGIYNEAGAGRRFRRPTGGGGSWEWAVRRFLLLSRKHFSLVRLNRFVRYFLQTLPLRR